MTDDFDRLLALYHALDAAHTRALVLLERFRDCCHSSTDVELYDDVERFLSENVAGTTHRLDDRRLGGSVGADDPRSSHGQAGTS